MFKTPSTFILLISSLLMITTLHGTVLDWEHDYDKALKQATKDKKIVYLFIGADRCKYCKKFKEMTLSKDEVIKTMQKNFILLYMSRDQHNIPDKFEQFGVPRHYFLTHKGEIIRAEQGIWDTQGWYSILDEVIEEKDDF
ncbi:MAG: thioredoxin family protein [Campylobacterota bacterium]|nr:thioredoxin family protein [Campylobacterota bacterium]